jgi:heme/copper-type cytochrome/quinol oxidase subunit 4
MHRPPGSEPALEETGEKNMNVLVLATLFIAAYWVIAILWVLKQRDWN